jgi:hypothetical protein
LTVSDFSATAEEELKEEVLLIPCTISIEEEFVLDASATFTIDEWVWAFSNDKTDAIAADFEVI